MKEQETKTYLETYGEDLLRFAGISKTEFAEKMGVKKQNVKALFATKNIVVIKQVAKVLGVPLMQLVSDEDVEAPSVLVNGYIQVNGDIMHVESKSDVVVALRRIEEAERKMEVPSEKEIDVK